MFGRPGGPALEGTDGPGLDIADAAGPVGITPVIAAGPVGTVFGPVGGTCRVGLGFAGRFALAGGCGNVESRGTEGAVATEQNFRPMCQNRNANLHFGLFSAAGCVGIAAEGPMFELMLSAGVEEIRSSRGLCSVA